MNTYWWVSPAIAVASLIVAIVSLLTRNLPPRLTTRFPVLVMILLRSTARFLTKGAVWRKTFFSLLAGCYPWEQDSLPIQNFEPRW